MSGSFWDRALLHHRCGWRTWRLDWLRYLLTIALLVRVWMHSDWSVALMLTLIAIAFESQL